MSNQDENLSRRTKAKIAAKLSFWLPVTAYAEMAASQAINPVYRAFHEWINYVSIALFGTFIAGGFCLGFLAVMRLWGAGRKSGITWAVSGISFNVVLVALVAVGIAASHRPPPFANNHAEFVSTNQTDPKLRHLLRGN